MPTRTEILDARILLVDDNAESVELLRQLLQNEGYRAVSVTTDPHQVAARHAEHHFDLIVLDLQMPGMDGFEVMHALKSQTTDYVPVLAVTGEPGHKLRALQAGAKDFVSKPFDWDEVFVRVYNMLEVKLLLDQAREHAKQLEAMALQDPLTGLANRRLVPERTHTAIAHARRNRNHMAMLYLDLDGFKEVNDTHGHPVGDRLLKMVARRLLSTVREEDTVARLGGDEFMLVLWEVTGTDDASTVAAKLIEAVAKPYVIDTNTLTVTTSVGLSIYPVHGDDCETLMKSADQALYQAKQSGKNTYRVAQPAA